MTETQRERMDEMLRIIRESAEKITDNTTVSDRELLMLLFQRGFQFLQRQSDQDIVDIGAVGLAYAVRRATGSK